MRKENQAGDKSRKGKPNTRKREKSKPQRKQKQIFNDTKLTGP